MCIYSNGWYGGVTRISYQVCMFTHDRKTVYAKEKKNTHILWFDLSVVRDDREEAQKKISDTKLEKMICESDTNKMYV